ncbi:MAG TPA: S41 family peptidase [Thermoanaerobaculia bacterium]|nr:S41 family peptidase [Thermoanaerobaculia bacterium]
MSRGRLLFVILSVVLVTGLLAGSLLGAASSRGDSGERSLFKYLSVFTEVLSLIRQAYVDETAVDALLTGALDGAADALDPFSLYVPAAQTERYAAARAMGSGRSGLLVLKERGMPYVASVWEGSPAAAAEVEVGDLIAEVDGQSTRLLPLWELHTRLAGAPGTKVELEMIRRGEPRQVTLELADTRPPAPVMTEREGVGYLRIPIFDAQTAAQTRAALTTPAAQAQRKLLVDLRGVGGGEGARGYDVARLLVEGELGALVGREGEISKFEGATPVWKGDIVVLMDRGTLGAAELLATVLRQKAGAKLVGERSFGYAGRQTLVELSTGARLQITDAFYTGPDRERIAEGLMPDERVDDRSRTFEERDTPLGELIFQRGLRVLRAEEPVKKAA